MKINNTPAIVANNESINVPKSQKVSFKGNLATSVKDSFSSLVKLERAGNMTRNLFVVNAFAFLLSGRLIKSRDKNEVRETATRDIPTILLAVFGVPVVEEYIAKRIHLNDKNGFAICNKSAEGKTSYKSAAYSQLNDWYKFDDKLSSGFKGFSERLSQKGGNLKKICSKLDKNIKADLAGFSDNNSEFVNQLFDNKNVELRNKVETAFKSGNKALDHAKWLKTIPTLSGFAITLSLIGITIPKLNIAITERINKKQQSSEKVD